MTHRFAKGTAAHVTADRSDGPGRRRKRKPVAQGGTAPHLGECDICGGPVIWHRRPGPVPTVKLAREELGADAGGMLFVIFGGAALADPDPRNVPEGMLFYREHVCPPSSETT